MDLLPENKLKRGLAPLALTAVLTILIFAVSSPAPAPAQDPLPSVPKPNIVLVMTDDQAAHTLTPSSMPTVHKILMAQGTSFTDHIVTTPLCCPSRATLLTGQYGHNNGVLRNDYALLREPGNVLPVWLQAAGYTTAHLGKWLNSYERAVPDPTDVAPGWDLWFTNLEKRKYYNWKASENGELIRFGSQDEDHLTDVTTRYAVDWTKQMVREDDPFYLQLDYYAPHGAGGRDEGCASGPVPAPRDETVFSNEPLRVPISFNEADVSDKPSFVRSRPLLDAADVDRVTRRYRCTLGSLRGADRGIRKVYRQIGRAGELENTVFIFASDNGFLYGEHRVPQGKLLPYDEVVRVPLVLLVPPALRGYAPQLPVSDAPVANVDVAPTILELTGASPCDPVSSSCRTLDGRSLMPLLRGGSLPADRAFLIELSDCTFRGVRGNDNVYLEYGTGSLTVNGECQPDEVEHYDLAADPGQLENLYPASRRSPAGETQLLLQQKMADLRDCAGIAGRDPLPPSGQYCE